MSGVVLRGPYNMRILDPQVAGRWSSYLFQSLLATLSLFIILLIEDAVLRAAIVVAVASKLRSLSSSSLTAWPQAHAG